MSEQGALASAVADSGTWHGVAASHVGEPKWIHGKEGMWGSGMKQLTFKANSGAWNPVRARGPGPKMVAAAAAATQAKERQALDALRPEQLRQQLHAYRAEPLDFGLPRLQRWGAPQGDAWLARAGAQLNNAQRRGGLGGPAYTVPRAEEGHDVRGPQWQTVHPSFLDHRDGRTPKEKPWERVREAHALHYLQKYPRRQLD
eukprot:COSAG01_NODE_6191_length_3802_cov_3.617607_4_plen_201_part_00